MISAAAHWQVLKGPHVNAPAVGYRERDNAVLDVGGRWRTHILDLMYDTML